MNIEIVGTIVRGAKRTRYLGRSEDGVYYSFKAESGSYSTGTKDDIPEEYLLKNPKQEWIDACRRKTSLYKRIISHLIEYKTVSLSDTRKGTFHGKQYNHVLVDEQQNLLKGYGFDRVIEDNFNDIKKRNELHIGFANMNSSQAFALNCFCPLIESGTLGTFLGIDDSLIKPEECKFEYVLNENEQTQFDFYIEKSELHPAISVEVKYTEEDFGIARLDNNHIQKYEEEYKSKLSTLTKKELSISEFFTKYQLWRNLSYVQEGQIICFLFPRFREDLTEYVKKAISMCRDEYKDQIKIIYADDIVQEMIHTNSNSLCTFYNEFSKKYLELE